MADAVSNRIRELREARRLTQGELARAARVSRQSINSIERGRYTPSLSLALRFARIFGCTLEDLFTLEE